jgi:predicted phosphodiesterase
VRVAALSDFHIGVRNYRDGFGHDGGAFSRFLDQLEREHDHIVLLGDIYQTDHALMPNRPAARKHLLRAMARVETLARRWSEPPYEYVFGNHDEVARDVLGAVETLVLGDERLTLLFTHGHQYDPIACKSPFFAKAGTWFTGQLRALGLRPVAAQFERTDIKAKHARFRGPEGPYARAGQCLAHYHDAHVVVMGHTHVAGLTRLGGERLLANTGSCSAGRLNYVSIDTRAGKVTAYTDDGVQSEALSLDSCSARNKRTA